MKVLYLFNNKLKSRVENVKNGIGHDSWSYGLFRLKKYDIEADYLELEKFLPESFAQFLRRHLLTMHYAHLVLFPLFFRYDIVFTSTAYSSLILKAFFGIRKFKWVIIDFNILGTIGPEKTLRQKIFAWAVSKADGVITISEAAAGAMRKRFPHIADNIVFTHEATAPEYFRPRNDIAEKNMIISVGNFGRDFKTLIEATKDLGIEVSLATKLIGKQEAASLPPHVKVGLYSHEEILRLYAESKIAVVGLDTKDEYYDSVGTFAVGEALSMGKATIVTHTKSMESYIEDGVNGFFVPYRDVEAMRTRITELLSNNPLRHRIGTNARAFAEKNLDSERFTQKLAQYFKKLISQ
jgi:glycosyltransferase involved in cell wall biosynthesis